MAWPGKVGGWCGVALLWTALIATGSVAGAQEPDDAPQDGEEGAAAQEPAGPRFDWGFEAKANFRDSDENRFAVPFVFPSDFLPAGQTQGFEETVNPGSHIEVSSFSLLLDATWGDGLAAHSKIDFIDLYDRNPTTSDRKVDVDEAWMRFGIEPEPATLAPRWGAYLKIGKMPKFERQDDRHLESYGLVSTAFNRFEDTGAELGVNLGRHVYVKLSATQGNPVFLRDPNALAGDNGTPAQERRPNPDPELGSGIVILYDAEVEDLDLDGELETGAGVGVRFADEAGRNGVDVLAWGYRRQLAETVELEGTFYGGDLDLLRGPGNGPILPLSGDDKEEMGANVWLYLGGFTFFGQYVDQELAGLPRTGIEGELAWRFELPLIWTIGEQQLFTFIQPAVRYSKIDNDFENIPRRPPFTPGTPAPSLAWDWEKIDAGVRAGLISGIDLTVEYADNRFILGSGAEEDNNELLATLRWRM